MMFILYFDGDENQMNHELVFTTKCPHGADEPASIIASREVDGSILTQVQRR